MSVVLITGLSGSGKTTALRALEDLGYFAMDNVPVVLLAKVVELADAQETPMRIAVVVDARDAQNLADAGGVVDQLRADGEDITIVYLRAGRETIIKRYKETRRRHPLESAGNVEDAIAHEAGLLQDLERGDGVERAASHPEALPAQGVTAPLGCATRRPDGDVDREGRVVPHASTNLMETCSKVGLCEMAAAQSH